MNSGSRFSRKAATPSLPSPTLVQNIASESARCASTGCGAALLRYIICRASAVATSRAAAGEPAGQVVRRVEQLVLGVHRAHQAALVGLLAVMMSAL